MQAFPWFPHVRTEHVHHAWAACRFPARLRSFIFFAPSWCMRTGGGFIPYWDLNETGSTWYLSRCGAHTCFQTESLLESIGPCTSCKWVLVAHQLPAISLIIVSRSYMGCLLSVIAHRPSQPSWRPVEKLVGLHSQTEGRCPLCCLACGSASLQCVYTAEMGSSGANKQLQVIEGRIKQLIGLTISILVTVTLVRGVTSRQRRLHSE